MRRDWVRTRTESSCPLPNPTGPVNPFDCESQMSVKTYTTGERQRYRSEWSSSSLALVGNWRDTLPLRKMLLRLHQSSSCQIGPSTGDKLISIRSTRDHDSIKPDALNQGTSSTASPTIYSLLSSDSACLVRLFGSPRAAMAYLLEAYYGPTSINRRRGGH